MNDDLVQRRFDALKAELDLLRPFLSWLSGCVADDDYSEVPAALRRLNQRRNKLAKETP